MIAASSIDLAAAEFAADRDRLRVVTEGALDRPLADTELATRALVGLVENALDLSPASEPVKLSIQNVSDDSSSIEVADRGPGVPEEQRERVPRVHARRTAAPHVGTRTRIGLFLTRRIMAAHGGGLTYRERAGGGSVFALVFPAAPEAVDLR